MQSNPKNMLVVGTLKLSKVSVGNLKFNTGRNRQPIELGGIGGGGG